MASIFHSHSGLSCLGHTAPLIMLKVTYLQAGDGNAVSSISVDSCGFDFFLILTLELLQDNYLEYNTALCLLKAKKKKRKYICLQLEAELECQNQHLFLKYSVPRPATLGHCHTMWQLYPTPTLVQSPFQASQQCKLAMVQARPTRCLPVPTTLSKPNVMLAKMQTDSSSVQQHVNEVFSAWIPKYTDYRMKNLSSFKF